MKKSIFFILVLPMILLVREEALKEQNKNGITENTRERIASGYPGYYKINQRNKELAVDSRKYFIFPNYIWADSVNIGFKCLKKTINGVYPEHY